MPNARVLRSPGASPGPPRWNEGRSVHIGVNAVDPGIYQDWLPPLVSAENDARAMRDLAESAGFSARTILGDDATRENVIACLAATIERLVPGDTLQITYAGHMTSLAGAGDDADGWDEAWCLHDGILLDDEFHDLLAGVPQGVDVLVITDACFGGGLVDGAAGAPAAATQGPAAGAGRAGDSAPRQRPAARIVRVSDATGVPEIASVAGAAAGSAANRAAPAAAAPPLAPALRECAGVKSHLFARGPAARIGDRQIADLVRQGRIPMGRRRPASDRPVVQATVIALAAAGEGAIAFEGDLHGLFTAAMLEAIRHARGAPVSYASLVESIAAALPFQRPSLGLFGAAVAQDVASRVVVGRPAPSPDAAPA